MNTHTGKHIHLLLHSNYNKQLNMSFCISYYFSIFHLHILYYIVSERHSMRKLKNIPTKILTILFL